MSSKAFEVYLCRAIRTEPVDWTEHYIDYGMLKKKLREYCSRRNANAEERGGRVIAQANIVSTLQPTPQQQHQQTQGSNDQQQESSSDCYFQYEDEHYDDMDRVERDEFCSLLQQQVEKASGFYKHLLIQLKEMITNLTENIKHVGNEVLECACFLVTNVITLRQILIRYNALVRTYYSDATASQLQLLLSEGSFVSVEQFDLKALIQLESQFKKLKCKRNVETTTTYLVGFSTQIQQFQQLLRNTNDAVEQESSGGPMVFRDQVIQSLRRYFLVGSVVTSLSLEPRILLLRGRHLKSEMEQLATWRETHASQNVLYTMDPQNVVPLALNLISCFLFMINHYIIEPSSAYYAEALGSKDAMAGVMLGAAPWFSLMSAVAYSFWTNTSYKRPILFAASLMVIGNWLYANAYSFQSMEMCLIGRSITGLGAPRIINRRYVADATPFSLRTAASAAFALATALGAALGPGMAIVLNLLEFEFKLPPLGTQYFNGMTGPGYFMALSWTLYTVCVIVVFKEPKRSGIDELRQREDSATSNTSSLMESTSAVVDNIDDWKENQSDENGPSTVDDSLVLAKESDNSNHPHHCFQHLTPAVVVCMSLIFMKRIALESIVGSTSIITKNRYGWTIKNVGTLHTVNGTIVIPVSILSGWLSQYYQDRYLSLWLLGVTLLGMLIMVDVTDLVSTENDTYNEGHWLAVGPVKYVVGSLIAFSGIEACESYVASLISKVVPSALAVGTFNSGLLTTLVGTAGRATGDLFITAMGLISIRNLLNLLIIPGICLVIISMVLIRRNYEILAV